MSRISSESNSKWIESGSSEFDLIAPEITSRRYVQMGRLVTSGML